MSPPNRHCSETPNSEHCPHPVRVRAVRSLYGLTIAYWLSAVDEPAEGAVGAGTAVVVADPMLPLPLPWP